MFDPTQPSGHHAPSPAAAASAEDTAALTRSLCTLAYAQFALVRHAGLDDLRSVTDHLAGTDEEATAEPADPSDDDTVVVDTFRAHGSSGSAPTPSGYRDLSSSGEVAVAGSAAPPTRSVAELLDLVPAAPVVSGGLDLDARPAPAPASNDLEGARKAYRGTLPPEDVAVPAGNNTMHLLEEIAFLEE